jgi:hypothetical protein
MNQAVILFHSTNHAIWADRELDKENILHKIVPVPRHLSSDCGYCIKLSEDDAERAASMLASRGIECSVHYLV